MTCPLHGWRWDLPSGGHMFSPLVRLSTYPVEILEGKISLVA